MRAFEIVWTEPALRELHKLDRVVSRRIIEKVRELRTNPYRYVTRLVNSPLYRLRVGKYRVILDVQGHTLRILVLKVGARSTAY